MFGRVSVHRFEWSAVNSEIGLLVAVQIDGLHFDWTVDWRLEDGSSNASPFPQDFARCSDVDRDDFCLGHEG